MYYLRIIKTIFLSKHGILLKLSKHIHVKAGTCHRKVLMYFEIINSTCFDISEASVSMLLELQIKFPDALHNLPAYWKNKSDNCMEMKEMH